MLLKEKTNGFASVQNDNENRFASSKSIFVAVIAGNQNMILKAVFKSFKRIPYEDAIPYASCVECSWPKENQTERFRITTSPALLIAGRSINMKNLNPNLNLRAHVEMSKIRHSNNRNENCCRYTICSYQELSQLCRNIQDDVMYECTEEKEVERVAL